MYLYFDRTGVLKEIINDEALRVGNENINTLYCFFEDTALLGATIWYKYIKADGTRTLAYETSTKETKEIPFDNKRDLRYFKYFTQYQFVVVPTSILNEFDALSVAGSVSCSITINKLGGSRVNGLVVFNVEESTYGNVIGEEQYVSIAQFNYLLSQFNNDLRITEINANTKIIDLAGVPKIIALEGAYYLTKVTSFAQAITFYTFEIEQLGTSNRWLGVLPSLSITTFKSVIQDNSYRRDYLQTQLNGYNTEIHLDGDLAFYVAGYDSPSLEINDDGIYINGDDIDDLLTQWNNNLVTITTTENYFTYTFNADGVYYIEFEEEHITGRRIFGIVQIETLSREYWLSYGKYELKIDATNGRLYIYDDGDEITHYEDYTLYIKRLY